MSRYTGPKNRIARRFGVNIFGKKRNPLIHKLHPPGAHGPKRKKKSDSEFGLQLMEQQKIKAVYGMLSKKQLVKYYEQSLSQPGNTNHLLLQKLETRLDNIVYRLGFAATIFQARQLVTHGHIRVDSKKVDIPSFAVRPGMNLSLSEKAQKMKQIQQALNSQESLPEYLTCDAKKMEGELIAIPNEEAIEHPLPINVALVCEFLAHNG
ncbi:MAG: 30S ribosomal protein S4 [Chlamydiota bacterium]|nr:30S ribosomal protein S4 [Chlamydiota bacterium]